MRDDRPKKPTAGMSIGPIPNCNLNRRLLQDPGQGNLVASDSLKFVAPKHHRIIKVWRGVLSEDDTIFSKRPVTQIRRHLLFSEPFRDNLRTFGRELAKGQTCPQLLSNGLAIGMFEQAETGILQLERRNERTDRIEKLNIAIDVNRNIVVRKNAMRKNLHHRFLSEASNVAISAGGRLQASPVHPVPTVKYD